jgi:hypothetical protein
LSGKNLRKGPMHSELCDPGDVFLQQLRKKYELNEKKKSQCRNTGLRKLQL